MKQLAMYINGRFENDFNGEWRDVLNPSTEETIAREPKGGRADVDRGARRNRLGSVCLRSNAARICVKSPKAYADAPTS